MNKSLYLIISFLLLVPVLISGQQAKDDKTEGQYKLTSDKLDAQGKLLDEEIAGLAQKMAQLIKKYDMINNKSIRILPYQTNYNLGSNYLEIEKYSFMKDEIYASKIIGIKKKKIKIFVTGQNISKIESEIYEKSDESGVAQIVSIDDPSPETVGSDDIKFVQTYKGKKVLDKKLGEVRNTTASQMRNEIKRMFLVPHYQLFYSMLQFIGEAYSSSQKDSDSDLTDFLMKSTKY